jgi:V8-like Glu-specific endopeptidase
MGIFNWIAGGMLALTGGIAPALAAGQAFAGQDNPELRALITADDSRAWDAVGRLNMGDGAFCTGALIAESIVLTAAHCLFDKRTGRRFESDEIEFLAGFRDGRAQAYRGVRQTVVHPDYDVKDKEIGRIARDLALIQLDQPIRNGRIVPFATHEGPATGDKVGVVSYAHDRAERPSLQELCHVLARQAGALILSCEVDFGSSGAPIFVFQDGQAQIVSVVSAMAEVKEQKVSIGTSLEQPLAELMAQLEKGDGVFHRAAPPVRRMSAGESRRAGSAKFVKP